MVVKVYSTPTCPYCHMAKDFLNANKIKFEDIDVSENENARNDMVEKSGQLGVPVLDIDGQIVVGFDKKKIAKILKIKEK
jgi:glutaredoxin-like YruB-family protein